VASAVDFLLAVFLWRYRWEVIRYCRDTFRRILARIWKSDD